MRIDIDAQSVALWNGEVVAVGETLQQRMEEVAARAVQPEVHIRPDRKARYEVVAAVLATAQRIGLTKIGIIGSEQFVQRTRS